ncbi:DUF2441 domain-containing protein [Rhodomicrobium sp. Az07]|uniref:DUF2441 domain-containing protein n=1 Tax=Rhodomicrobium sp. Az07 TaxID=2839034 RepID=UPI001BE9381E|nr:DUF2441 domain-containing protein [Rhodomicrobium sp. Az07]MBT3072130.1 DUF2441 domain-containing protein [Rhodomicrobium sp. Az07]
MQRTYFHCAPLPLHIGSIIYQGNWGRLFSLYEAKPGEGLPTNAFKEVVLELSRKLYAPDAPSRLDCVFVTPTIEEAIAFRNKYQRTNLIYEVTPVGEAPPLHVGSYELALAPYPQKYFQAIFDMGRDYWTVPATANREVLIGSPVRIEHMCEVPTPPALVFT